MGIDTVDVEIRLTKSLVVHDVLEYKMNDLIQEFIDAEESQMGSKVCSLIWADGVAMFIEPYTSHQYAEEEANGTLHFKRVMYAMKEKFEKRVNRTDEVDAGRVPKIINLIDQSEIPLYRDLSKRLKEWSQWRKDQAEFQGNLEKIEEEVGEFDAKEYEFFKAGSRLGLSASQIANQLKEFKGIASENPPHNKRLAEHQTS